MDQELTRGTVDPRYTWDVSRIYESDEAWEHAFEAAKEQADALAQMAGTMKAGKDAVLTALKLEAMTCVCSVGLDMIAVPGDTPAETISAIIADEAAIGMVNHKTTAVSIIPAPGKDVGDEVEFGGLFGRAPIMRVSPYSAEKFIARGGRIPAPLQSLKN